MNYYELPGIRVNHSTPDFGDGSIRSILTDKTRDGYCCVTIDFDNGIERNYFNLVKGLETGLFRILDNKVSLSCIKEALLLSNIEKCKELLKKEKISESALAARFADRTANYPVCSYLKSRGVSYLVHFTKVTNIPGIIKYGIVPRALLDRRNIEYDPTDPQRLDNMEFGSSFSISFPNYKYFYSRRYQNGEAYAVIFISVDLFKTLNENEMAFFPFNAASVELKGRFNSYHGLDKLVALFEDTEYKKRDLLSIPDSYTTDPQAEVIISKTVDPKFIKEIHVDSVASYNNVYRALTDVGKNGSIKCLNSDKYFRPRCDYQKWYKGRA